MIQGTIPKATTRSAHSPPTVKIDIFLRQFMSALAMRACPAIFSMFRDRFFLRFCIVVMSFWREHFFERPSLTSAIPYGSHINATTLAQFSNVMCDTLYYHHTTAPFIPSLFGARCPFAIVRGIRSIVIFAFERVPRWALAHITLKSRERGFPFIAYLNTSRSIVLESPCSWVIAARKHVPPCLINALSGPHPVTIQQFIQEANREF